MQLPSMGSTRRILQVRNTACDYFENILTLNLFYKKRRRQNLYGKVCYLMAMLVYAVHSNADREFRARCWTSPKVQAFCPHNGRILHRTTRLDMLVELDPKISKPFCKKLWMSAEVNMFGSIWKVVFVVVRTGKTFST